MKNSIYLIMMLLLLPLPATAKLKVVASTSDLACFARQVGGDLIDVEAIAPPKADMHFIEVRPSYMMKVSRADVALKVGLELDMWMDRIIDGSRNDDLEIVDCSKYIQPLEVPTFKADARYGDLHRYGNPHYWLGPQNVGAITEAIVEGLAAADPANAEVYAANQKDFLTRLEAELVAVRERAAPLRGKEVIFYHNSWPYFNEFSGLTTVGFVELYPGVPPSPSHIKEMTEMAQARGIKVIAVEPYFDKRVPKKIAEASGASVVTLYPSVGGRDKSEGYIDWLKGNIDVLLEVLE